MAADTLPAEPEPSKSLFDKVMTTTPVLLTVIATFLVGQSTSEMTQAQYYRSLAGQNQAKAGDQWALFQAKRARGQTQEMAATLLAAQSQTYFTRRTFLDVAKAMHEKLRSAEEAFRDGAIFLKAQPKEADDLKRLMPRAQTTLEQAQSLFGSPGRADAALDVLLMPRAKKRIPVLKEATEAKSTTSPDEDPESNGQLSSVIEDIKQKKPESAIAKKALKLKDETLDKAIADSERRANGVNSRGKKIETVLEELDELLERQIALARELQDEQLAEFGFNKLTRQLQADYMAARLAYTARRYEDDARSNQESAYLYEVKVYLNSARSDKHLFRSKMFMFAMLAAQAGVTISTLALAVKRKSPFWLIATLVGLIAVALGVYVYLDLPMPTF